LPLWPVSLPTIPIPLELPNQGYNAQAELLRPFFFPPFFFFFRGGLFPSDTRFSACMLSPSPLRKSPLILCLDATFWYSDSLVLANDLERPAKRLDLHFSPLKFSRVLERPRLLQVVQ